MKSLSGKMIRSQRKIKAKKVKISKKDEKIKLAGD